MCGVAGVIYKNDKIVKADTIKKMTNSIKHRGPDAEGSYIEGNIGLGHRRLSIVDLSLEGNQPMLSYDKRYVIVFNGEIYNYIELKNELLGQGAKFNNNTDTEVIIEAFRIWGNKCVTYFNGMWAFVIYDRIEKTIFFSRDRFGIKPLYYINRQDTIAFASEIKAILEAFPEEKITNESMIHYYLRGNSPDSRTETFFKNIISLPPATCAQYDLKNQAFYTWKYWEIDEQKCYNTWIKGKSPVRTFKNLIEDAVKIRLRADVEVGACLSGGIDSSVIVGIASKKYKKVISTFSSVYEDKDCNEKEYIDSVNQYTGSREHIIFPEPEKNLLEDIKKITWHHDAPNGGASLYSQYSVMKGVAGNVKVLLDGQGADELFGGYIPYYNYRLTDILKHKGIKNKIKALKLITEFEEEWPQEVHFISSELLRRYMGKKIYNKFLNKHKYNQINHYKYNIDIFKEDFKERIRDKSYELVCPKKMQEDLTNVLYWDVVSRSIPELLHNEDGNSMAFSIESRVPFLDYRIVEFAMALSGEYKIKGSWTKWIIRKACREYLPLKVAYRKNKMGFPAPFSRWLRECNEKDDMKELIYSFAKRGIVKEEAIESYYEQHMQKVQDRSGILYKFLSLEIWYRQFIDNQ